MISINHEMSAIKVVIVIVLNPLRLKKDAGPKQVKVLPMGFS